jgi:hypothetical protein
VITILVGLLLLAFLALIVFAELSTMPSKNVREKLKIHAQNAPPRQKKYRMRG